MGCRRTAMIVAPHPDDAELAMGGTIVRLLQYGWELIIVDLTDGEPTPFGTRDRRAREAQEATRILGVTRRLCLEMPNRRLEPTIENRRRLAGAIRMHRPSVLFGPLAPDYHPDHVAAAQLVEASRFEAKLHKTDLPGGPHWAPRLYRYYSTHRLHYAPPSLVVDVTNTWDRKVAAIRAYASQMNSKPATGYRTLIEYVEVVGRFFGLSIGCEFGEPFTSREPLGVRIPDLFQGLD